MMVDPVVGVAIMAHRKRARFIPSLQASLDRPAQVVWDQHNDRWETGRRAMLAYRTNPRATHWLVVQDDAVACRDLVAGVEAALRHVPADSPVSLYAGRVRPFRDAVAHLVGQADRDTSWLTMTQLHWGVGVVIPVRWIDEMVRWCDTRTDVANYDKRMSRWIQHRRLTVHYTWPSLVDHRESPSLVPGRSARGRRAYRFIGAGRSALGVRWDGKTVAMAALARYSSGKPAARARPVVPARVPLLTKGETMAGFHDPYRQKDQIQQYLRQRRDQRRGAPAPVRTRERSTPKATKSRQDAPVQVEETATVVDTSVPERTVEVDEAAPEVVADTPPPAPERPKPWAPKADWAAYAAAHGPAGIEVEGLTKQQLIALVDRVDAE